MKRARDLAVLLALAAALGLAGCGGDDDDSAETAASAGTEASAEPNKRLSEESWATYVETMTAAQAVNQKSVAAFATCRELMTGTTVDEEATQKCLGTATVSVVEEGQKVLATLDDLDGEAGGACKEALDMLDGNIRFYTSSIQGIELSVQRGELPTSVEIDGASEVLSGARAAAADVERDCKPV